MTKVALLRHFPTDWNAEGRLQGRTDIPLSGAALGDLARLSLPAPWRDCPIFVSPLQRARQTIATLAPHADVIVDPDLVEMDFGDWEGRIGAELLADPASGYRPSESWGWDFRPPGGESPTDMATRLRAVLARVAAHERALIVTHRGVMRCILALASGWNYDGPEPFRIKRARLHPLTLAPDGAPGGIETPLHLATR